ncbi:hypothetical protein ACEE18_12435, partial [Corynebacterium freneyi]
MSLLYWAASAPVGMKRVRGRVPVLVTPLSKSKAVRGLMPQAAAASVRVSADRRSVRYSTRRVVAAAPRGIGRGWWTPAARAALNTAEMLMPQS